MAVHVDPSEDDGCDEQHSQHDAHDAHALADEEAGCHGGAAERRAEELCWAGTAFSLLLPRGLLVRVNG